MINLQNATYIHPNKEVLFEDLNFTVNKQEKIALIGNNGIGKSTLLKIIAGQLPLSSGQLSYASSPYYIPQILDSYNGLSISQALGVSQKLTAFQQILAGKLTEENMEMLNDDWTIEDRIHAALGDVGLSNMDLATKIGRLSGGQKTKVFLAGIFIQDPEIVLLDEPSNHLDSKGRALLYDLVEKTNKTLLIVSHDRQLLKQLSTTVKFTKKGLTRYGGNYDFYKQQKSMAQQALDQELIHQQKELNKAKNIQREAIQRQAKLNARGKKKQEQAGVPKIMINVLKNKAEGSS
ncbi:MAG: ATP-binding cassette domain-containing protein, partial [Sphingobacterium sp.]